MKTVTIVKELYEYDELPDEVKDKVIEKQWDINVDGDYWHDYDGKTGFTSKELKRMRIDVPDLKGNGELLTYKKVYFSIDRDWYIQFVDAEFTDDEIARKFLRVPKDIWNRTRWTINDQPYRETNTRLEWEYEDLDGYTIDASPRVTAILDRAVEIFSDKIEEALRGLRDSYDALCERDAIEDTIRANEYTFNFDGDIDNG